jgi:hypothetical protein
MEKIYSDQFLCEVFSILYQNEVCMRCIFRFFKLNDISLYRNKQEYKHILQKINPDFPQ